MLFIRRCAVVFIAAIGPLASHSLTAAIVTLNVSNAAGTSSFASNLNWSDGLAPSAGNDYVVDSGRQLRNVADSSGTVTFAGDSLTLGTSGSSAGILIFKNLSGAVVEVNNLTLNNGEVQAGGTAAGAVNSTTLGGSITLGANASRFNSGTTGRSIIVSASVTGGGNVSFTSGGWTQFSNAANNYSGTSTVSAGMFRAADGTSLPTASNLILNGGIFGTETDFTRNFGTGAGEVQLGTGNAGFAAFGATRNVNLNGGSGLTWGTAPFNIGTLILSHATSDATLVFQNAIDLGASTRTIQVDDGSAGVDAELSGALSGTTAGITKSGGGTLIISSANNNFAGNNSIGTNGTGARIGVLRAAANQAIGTGLVSIGPGGNDASARLELVNGISLPNNIDLPGRNNTTVAIQNISGSNTITGSVNINSGGSDYRIQADAGLLTLAGGINIPSVGGTRTATLQGAGNGEVSGDIVNSSGTLNVAKEGAGLWTLSGNNTYAGTTTVTLGTLLINGTKSGTGAVNVANNATLGGSGSIAGAITVATGGTLAPGGSVGQLTMTGNVIINSNGFFEVQYDSSAQTIDLATVGGTFDINGGTVNFADVGSGALNQSSYVFATFTGGTRTFTATNVPVGYLVQEIGQSLALVQAIPEAGSFLCVGLAGLLSCGFSTFRRRRNNM